jgi:hypothetical protein
MAIQSGEKYGRLTPLYVVGKTSYRVKIWHCKCDCGNFKDIPSTSLTSGNTRSCGCLQKETITKIGEKTRFKKGWSLDDDMVPENKYDISGEYCIGYTPKGDKFYFDLEDYDKIKDYLWYTKEDGYLICQQNGRTIRMNRLIMDCTDSHKDVHHKNHVVYDNRKYNLEICEHYENMIATKTYSNNTSGRKEFIGIRVKINGLFILLQIGKHTLLVDMKTSKMPLKQGKKLKINIIKNSIMTTQKLINIFFEIFFKNTFKTFDNWKILVYYNYTTK